MQSRNFRDAVVIITALYDYLMIEQPLKNELLIRERLFLLFPSKYVHIRLNMNL